METYSIGYFLGPTISLGNMMIASDANTKLYKELLKYNILNLKIAKGESVYGLVSFKMYDYAALSLKFINKQNNYSKEESIKGSGINNIVKNDYDQKLAILKNNLYKTDTLTSFHEYYNKIIHLSKHPNIESVDLVKEEYSNGNTRSIGLKAKHHLNKSTDNLYSNNNYFRIGTWMFYHENGLLKVLVDYNLSEELDGRYIEFDTEGKIIKEMTYSIGDQIK